MLGHAYQTELNLVFCTGTGGPLSARNLYRAYKGIVGKADIPDINWHALRHAHATLLLQEGAPIAFVSERLGHANPAVTLSIYTHAVPGLQAAFGDRIDDWLGAETRPA